MRRLPRRLPRGRRLTSSLPALCVGLGTLASLTAAADELPTGDATRGEALAHLAGCPACHTAEGGAPYAGGYPVETPFGTFYGTNLTPDPTHGLGGWTPDHFARAVRHGRGPDGTRYWPAFPFPAFTALTDADVADLWAHLAAQEPVATPDRPHDIGRGRWQLRLWRPLAFRPRGPLDLDGTDPEWARGAYLVRAVAHCGECHTPRGAIGGTRDRRYLGGSDLPPDPGPNITPHPDALGAWTASDWATFLETGMTASGDWVGGEMLRVVEDGTARLTEADRSAMVTFLMGVRPVEPRRSGGGDDGSRSAPREAWE